MLPRLGSSKLISAWITITLVASIVAVVDGGWLSDWLAFAPARIWRGELWRLATWVVIQPAPMGLIVTCISIYKFGGDLAVRWGDRRLQRFMVEIVGGAAIAAALLAFFSDSAWRMVRFDGWVVEDALVIAWARQFPDSSISIYGLLQVRGRALIAITIGITVVFAIFHGPFVMAPELLVCAAVYRYPAAWLARR